MGSALDAHDISAEQSRVDAADHERKHTQQRHRGGADGYVLIKETAVISIARNATNARMFSQMFFIAATS